MNRNQRRLVRVPPKYNESEGRLGPKRLEVEEVLPPKGKRNIFIGERPVSNRCTFFTPSQRDFGQLTESDQPVDKYQDLLREQYGFETISPDTIKQLMDLKKMLCSNEDKVENSAQCVQPENKSVIVATPSFDAMTWLNIDTVDDIERYLEDDKNEPENEVVEKLSVAKQVIKVQSVPIHVPRKIQVSDVPRVKIIAVKFSKFKKNYIELRKLDEKVVCLEYDILDQDSMEPFQIMRAFFSIKPDEGDEGTVKNNANEIPLDVKRNFNITDEDLNKLNAKEIEIIDGKIAENRAYLDDLKRVLRKKLAIDNKKKQSSLDLMYLYEMAKRESPPLADDYSRTNLLSKSELQEIKDLILKKCGSSVYGISRRTVRCDSVKEGCLKHGPESVISNSMIKELMRATESNSLSF